MRKFRRLAGMALAAVMTLAMCAPAFAVEGDGGQEPVPGETTEVKYNVYQIFTGTYANLSTDESATLGDIKWGANGRYVPEGEDNNTAVSGESVPETVLDELVKADGKTSDKEKLEIITKYVDFGSPFVSGESLEQLGTRDDREGWENGYYLVRPVGSDNANEDTEYVPYVVTVINKKLALNPKKGVPTVEKTVTKNKDEEGQKVGAASIGDTLYFKIVGTLPDNLADYKSYFYTFTDTMSKGMQFDKKSVKVSIEGTGTLKEDQFYVGEENQQDGTTVITIGVNNLKSAVENLSASDKVVVTYSATLTKEAYVGKDPNTNEVKLTYSNDPRKNSEGKPNKPEEKPEPDPNDPTGETVKGENGKTETYVTGLTVTDFADGKPMTGAEFVLTGDGINSKLTVTTEFVEIGDGETGVYYKLVDNTYTTAAPTEETKDQYESYTEGMKPNYKIQLDTVSESNGIEGNDKSVKASIDENGSLTITGLSTGQYTLHQNSAPAGYNVHHDIIFTVSFEDGTFSEGEATGDQHDDEVKVDNNWFYIHINQGRGSLLPETGGMGTTLLYIGGVLLIAAAGATFILRGKKEEEAI